MKDNFDELLNKLMDAGFFLEQAVEIVERGMIRRALERESGNQSQAAKRLGIHRNTLQRKMVEYQIDGKRPRRKPVARAPARLIRRPRKAS